MNISLSLFKRRFVSFFLALALAGLGLCPFAIGKILNFSFCLVILIIIFFFSRFFFYEATRSRERPVESPAVLFAFNTQQKELVEDIFLLKEKRGLEERERESGSDPQSSDLWPCFISFVFKGKQHTHTTTERNLGRLGRSIDSS